MHYDLAQATPREIYNLLIGVVAPRPIALVTSMDLEGNLNAAPFSAFNYVATDPPVIAIGFANPPVAQIAAKDTARNIRNTREFVVNVVNEEIAEAMNICAIDFPPEINELEIAELETAPSTWVKVPRIASSPASLECRELSTIEIGRSKIVLAQVVGIYVRDEFIDKEKTYVISTEMHAIGRMNGLGNYVKTRDSFLQIPRISYEEWQEKNSPNHEEK